MYKLALLSLVLALASGCGTIRDRRDAPWDPRPGQSLFDQIPNEDGGANRICCGHLRVCERHQTPRC